MASTLDLYYLGAAGTGLFQHSQFLEHIIVKGTMTDRVHVKSCTPHLTIVY